MSSITRLSMRASMGESGVRILPEMFKNKLVLTSEETVSSLQKIWKEAGYEESECQRLLGDLLNKIKLTCQNEVAAEQQILDHAKSQIENSISDLSKLNEQLGRTTSVEYLAVMNCTDKLAELEKLLNEVGKEVTGRQKLLDIEMNAINTLVRDLGETSPNESQFRGPPGTPLLSDIRLQLMRECRAELETVKSKRIEEMTAIGREAFAHMSDLMYIEEGFHTMSDSETYMGIDKQIARLGKHNEFAFAVHRRDLSALQMRVKRFVDEKEKRRSELAKTGEEIARLWTLLRVPAAERELFTSSFKKNLSMETLSRGMDELNRLREIRKTSLARVITSIRCDILSLWEECGIDSEDARKHEFPSYFIDVETLADSSVDEHEQYFHMLRARVEELKPILLKISKRETVVQERVELEHLQMNPERLTARGPNAREERKREEAMTNRVKNLEKITKEIAQQIATWEETNGPFVYAGERYLERMNRQEESYVEIRDNLRNARKKKDGKNEPVCAMKTLPGVKRTLGASTTMSATTSTSNSLKKTASTTSNTTSINTSTALPAPAMVVSTSSFPPQIPHYAVDAENVNNINYSNSRDSECGTVYTSVTKVRERLSDGSATVVRESA